MPGKPPLLASAAIWAGRHVCRDARRIGQRRDAGGQRLRIHRSGACASAGRAPGIGSGTSPSADPEEVNRNPDTSKRRSCSTSAQWFAPSLGRCSGRLAKRHSLLLKSASPQFIRQSSVKGVVRVTREKGSPPAVNVSGKSLAPPPHPFRGM